MGTLDLHRFMLLLGTERRHGSRVADRRHDRESRLTRGAVLIGDRTRGAIGGDTFHNSSKEKRPRWAAYAPLLAYFVAVNSLAGMGGISAHGGDA